MVKMELYPEITAYNNGYLKVSDEPLHELYYEEYGNSVGQPVIFIHGGPGSGCKPSYARFFDPEFYRIILFDQRGAGKSKPHASLENNTIWHLIDDITKLRAELGINGKMHVFGGSWGSTLSLTYAINHPETVKSLTLRGIFLCRREDLSIFYQGDAADLGNPQLIGIGRFFPEAWQQYVEFIPQSERSDMIAAYNKRLTGSDEEERLEAAKRWSVWEGATSKLVPDPDFAEEYNDRHFALSFARIENHYFINGGFLDKEKGRDQNYILDNISKISDIEAHVVHGRYDMVCPRNQADELIKAWPEAKLYIIDDAGHNAMEPGLRAKLVEIMNAKRV